MGEGGEGGGGWACDILVLLDTLIVRASCASVLTEQETDAASVPLLMLVRPCFAAAGCAATAFISAAVLSV